jgi:hypothetical protein
VNEQPSFCLPYLFVRSSFQVTRTSHQWCAKDKNTRFNFVIRLLQFNVKLRDVNCSNQTASNEMWWEVVVAYFKVIPNEYRGSFPGTKWTDRETHHSHNQGLHITTSLHIFMEWYGALIHRHFNLYCHPDFCRKGLDTWLCIVAKQDYYTPTPKCLVFVSKTWHQMGIGIVSSWYRLDYGLDELGFESWQKQGIFVFSNMSRPALRLSRPSTASYWMGTGFHSRGKVVRVWSWPFTSI